VAFVFHAGYEIFDQIGPGLLWWAWNPRAPSNTPMLGAAPLSSAILFAAAAPFGTTLLTRWLLVRGRPHPPWSVGVRTVAVGVLSPLGMLVFSAPTRLFGLDGGAVVLWLELAALASVTAWAFVPALCSAARE